MTSIRCRYCWEAEVPLCEAIAFLAVISGLTYIRGETAILHCVSRCVDPSASFAYLVNNKIHFPGSTGITAIGNALMWPACEQALFRCTTQAAKPQVTARNDKRETLRVMASEARVRGARNATRCSRTSFAGQLSGSLHSLKPRSSLPPKRACLQARADSYPKSRLSTSQIGIIPPLAIFQSFRWLNSVTAPANRLNLSGRLL